MLSQRLVYLSTWDIMVVKLHYLQGQPIYRWDTSRLYATCQCQSPDPSQVDQRTSEENILFDRIPNLLFSDCRYWAIIYFWHLNGNFRFLFHDKSHEISRSDLKTNGKNTPKDTSTNTFPNWKAEVVKKKSYHFPGLQIRVFHHNW